MAAQIGKSLSGVCDLLRCVPRDPRNVGFWHFATRTNALTLRPVLRALWKRWACRLSRLRRTDPNVWSGRALQEDFVELADVRSCINVSGRTWTDAQDHARLAEMYRLLLVRAPHFMLITVQPFFFASS
jgi:hypothetical protein